MSEFIHYRTVRAINLEPGDVISVEITDGIGEHFTVEKIVHLSRKQVASLGLSSFHRWAEITINGRTKTLCDADTFELVVVDSTKETNR